MPYGQLFEDHQIPNTHTFTLLSACRDMPELAASEIMAIYCVEEYEHEWDLQS